MTQYYSWLEQFLTIPQLIGILGYFVGVSAFLQRHDSAFRKQLTAVNIIMAIHFYLLGPTSYPAALLNIINIFRNIASAYTRNIFVMLFFVILMWLVIWPTIIAPIQYLSVIGTSLVTFALFRLKQQVMRFVILLSSILWIIYSIWIGSIGSLAIELTFSIINIITIIKMTKSNKNCMQSIHQTK